MFKYKVDLNPILEIVGGWVDAADSIPFKSLSVGDETFVARGPATFEVQLINAGEGIVLTGSISAPVTTTCARCLREFDLELAGDVEGIYLGPGDEAVGEEDDAVPVTRDGTVDIGPALYAGLVIDAPFAPLHDPDCAGLCVECGADLNEGRCACNADRVDPAHPFAGLKDLLDGREN